MLLVCDGLWLVYLREKDRQLLQKARVARKHLSHLIFELLLCDRFTMVKIEDTLDVLVILLDFRLILHVQIETLHDVLFDFRLNYKSGEELVPLGPELFSRSKMGQKSWFFRQTYENSLSEFLWEQLDEDLVERLNIAHNVKNFLERVLVIAVTPTHSQTRGKPKLSMMRAVISGRK